MIDVGGAHLQLPTKEELAEELACLGTKSPETTQERSCSVKRHPRFAALRSRLACVGIDGEGEVEGELGGDGKQAGDPFHDGVCVVG